MRLLFSILVLWISAFSAVQPADAAQRPNILLIVSEDNGPELGCYGTPSVQTPHLDQLAADGVRFDRAFVAQAGCSQSRAALLTGLYPHQNGQIGLATWKFRLYDPATPNLVRSLKKAGYRTGIIGKLHINPAEAFPFDFKAIPSSNFGRKNLPAYATEAAKFFRGDYEPPRAQPGSSTGGREDGKTDRPFFLSINYPDAHRPFTTQVKGIPKKPLTGDDVEPLPYFGLDSPHLRQETADYLNCMSRLDTQVGELLDVLRASGKADNTLIVYMGDHGADMLRGKRTSYEGGLRVPLIASWPGHIESGQVRDELVSTLDLMPTFLEAAGATTPPKLSGTSLLPLLDGSDTEWREYLFTEYHLHSAHNFYPQRTVRGDRYKLIENLMPGEINPGYDFTKRKFFNELDEVVAAAPEKVRSAYELMKRPPPFELYDLKHDPYEFNNLARNPTYVKHHVRLRKQLDTWKRETNDPLLDSNNLARLKAEVDACLTEDGADKSKLNLTYPDYFFSDSSAPPPLRVRPNVLFIAIDDLRPALGCYGDPIAHTPNIDRLAARGTTFLRAYCQQAVCAPSRLSLITGRYPDRTKVWDLSTHFRKALPDVVTLPQHFKNHGYHTRSIGKILHGSGAPAVDPPSWSVDPLLDTNRDPELRYALPENLEGKGLKRNASESADVPDNHYIDGLIADKALIALESYAEAATKGGREDGKTGGQFFLAVGFKKPHLPFCAPKKYWDLYDPDKIPKLEHPKPPAGSPELATRSWKELEGYRDIPADGSLTPKQVRRLRHGYYACVSYIDAQVGRLLDRLDSLGLTENTLIALWGDHGFHLGEQGIWTKSNNYELSTRVPLIISSPSQKRPGATSDALVELVDLYPTLTHLAGLPRPKGLDGSPLSPLLDRPGMAWAELALSQFPRHRSSNRHKGRGDLMGYTIRTADHRYVEWIDNTTSKAIATELYDHRHDPHETTNIAPNPEHATLLNTLSNKLHSRLTP